MLEEFGVETRVVPHVASVPRAVFLAGKQLEGIEAWELVHTVVGKDAEPQFVETCFAERLQGELLTGLGSMYPSIRRGAHGVIAQPVGITERLVGPHLHHAMLAGSGCRALYLTALAVQLGYARCGNIPPPPLLGGHEAHPEGVVAVIKAAHPDGIGRGVVYEHGRQLYVGKWILRGVILIRGLKPRPLGHALLRPQREQGQKRQH